MLLYRVDGFQGDEFSEQSRYAISRRLEVLGSPKSAGSRDGLWRVRLRGPSLR